MNLTVHYNRVIYIVEPTSEALRLRRKRVDVHDTSDGRVMLRVDGLDLNAVPFDPEGGVRQQDIDDNKYLASTLAKIRQDPLARDEQKLTRLKTLREKRKLEASLSARRQAPNPTLLFGAEPDISTLA